MTSIANLSSVPAALSAITAHSHGHRKGSHVESTSSDSGGDAMTPVPASTQQNLFSSMLQSLEQVIGVQPATSASSGTATPASTAAAGGITASAPATVASTSPASAATASSNAALQKYLNKVSSQINDVKFPAVAGSNVSVNVNA
jgi:hypothetical protein